MAPGLEVLALKRCPGGLCTANSPWPPEPLVPEVTLVWAACTLLLFLGHDCCGLAGVKVCLLLWLSVKYGHEFYGNTGKQGWPMA